MNIEVFYTHNYVKASALKDKTAVVIDVLRATSFIIAALENGAKAIVPVDSIPRAFALAKKSGRGKVVLCGERFGHIIKGFDMGNSPLEFTAPRIAGKTMIMATTNGTRACIKSAAAKETFLAAFTNIDAVADRIVRSKRDIAILCSGKEGGYSLEDTVCAGMLIFCLERRGIKAQMDDAALAACAVFKEWLLNIEGMLNLASHGKYLVSTGHGEDLAACARINQYRVVPVYRNGRIVKNK